MQSKHFLSMISSKKTSIKLVRSHCTVLIVNLLWFLRISFFTAAQFYGGQNHKKWNSLVEFKQLQGESEPILKMPRIFPIRYVFKFIIFLFRNYFSYSLNYFDTLLQMGSISTEKFDQNKEELGISC